MVTQRTGVANKQSRKQLMTEVKQLIRAQSDRNKASDLSESGRIAIDLTKEQLTKYENEYKYRQRFEI